MIPQTAPRPRWGKALLFGCLALIGFGIVVLIACVTFSVVVAPSTDFGPAESDADRATTELLRSYLAENYAGTGDEGGWYDQIAEVSVRHPAAMVKLRPGADEAAARRVCVAVSLFVYGTRQADLGLDTVRIYDSDSRRLVERDSPSASCRD